MRLELDGKQKEGLRKALQKAFKRDELAVMLSEEADQNIDDLTPANVVDLVAYSKVIEAAEMVEWTDKLVLGAAAWRPNNKVLARFLEEHQVSSASEGRLAVRPEVRQADSPRYALQRLAHAEAQWTDFELFLGRLGELESQVCRIELNGGAVGSGFLVGPDLVLTNGHVMETFKDRPEAVVCRFDYRRIGDTTAERPGVTFALKAGDWNVAFSPWAEGDDKPGGKPPTKDELDYALLRLRDPAGASAKGKDVPGVGEPRGHIRLPAAAAIPKKPAPMFLLQHPLGGPLKLAVGSTLDQVNDFRIRYSADSEAGSSGSPLFDSKLDLVGLHHASDPNFAHAAEYNQGIPIALIVNDLRDRDKLPPI
jgi:hypothetical protein